MGKKYLFWDFDATLAYRDVMWTRILYDLLQENGQTEIGFEEVKLHMGRGCSWHSPQTSHETFFKGVLWWTYMTGYFTKICCEMGVDKELSQQIAEQFHIKYLNLSNWHLFDDTIGCLEKAIVSGYTNFIVSNHVPELPELVRGLGIEKYFVKIINSADVGYEKPNPEIFKAALRGLDDTKAVTMIGDNITADVAGALNMGLKAILVRSENILNYRYYSPDLNGIFDVLASMNR